VGDQQQLLPRGWGSCATTTGALEKSFDDCCPIFEACGNANTIILSLLPPYLTVECCQDKEHTPNQNLGNFKSTFISGLKRTKKNLKQLVEKANMPSCKVNNPLWLLAGPEKLPESYSISFTSPSKVGGTRKFTPAPAQLPAA
jgi:hypothetical protein